MAFYPIALDLYGRKCLVIGGGGVARRKVSGLCAAGAEVHVISPQLVPELLVMVRRGEIRWSERDFAPGDLRGAFLVFAATDSPVVQQQVQNEAERSGILVNLAAEPAGSSFHVPAHFRRYDDDSVQHGRLFSDLLTAGIVKQILVGEWQAVVRLLESFLPQEIDVRQLVEEFVAGRQGAST